MHHIFPKILKVSYFNETSFADSTSSNFISCNGYATAAKFTPNYAAPFKLSMTINTSLVHYGNGGIFSDRLEPGVLLASMNLCFGTFCRAVKT